MSLSLGWKLPTFVAGSGSERGDDNIDKSGIKTSCRKSHGRSATYSEMSRAERWSVDEIWNTLDREGWVEKGEKDRRIDGPGWQCKADFLAGRGWGQKRRCCFTIWFG